MGSEVTKGERGEQHSPSQRKGGYYFWGIAVGVCLLLLSAAMPFVQNYRAIQHLKSIQGDCICEKEPGIFLNAIPTDWQNWLRETVGDDCLLPFETVTGIFFNHPASIRDRDLSSLKGLTNLEGLYLSNTKVSDAGVRQLESALPDCQIDF